MTATKTQPKIHSIDTGIAELLFDRIPADLIFYKNQFGICGISESEGHGAARYIDNIHVDNISEYSILGVLCNLPNEYVERLMPIDNKLELEDPTGDKAPIWKNYTDDRVLVTAWQSLYSCIAVHGLLTKEPIKPKFNAMQLVSPAVDTDTPVQQYKKDMDRYINPKTTLVLKKRKS